MSFREVIKRKLTFKIVDLANIFKSYFNCLEEKGIKLKLVKGVAVIFELKSMRLEFVK